MPLVRSLSREESDQLLGKIPRATMGVHLFESRTVSPRTLEEAVADLIPSQIIGDLPRSFDIVGDIAVLELGSSLEPYEKPLAQAILAVHRNVKSVFAKAGPVSGAERVRPLRHIAGDDRTETVHREFGCSFRVDLSRVFFSPRLSTEHQRVAEQVEEGECVIDMFAGAGPFSVLIAKTARSVRVNAIDSNPEAVRLIQENARANRVASRVRAYLGDAKDVVRRELVHTASRAIMNHPSAAKQFVDVACEALRRSGGVVHYYTFAEGADCEDRAREEFERAVEKSGYSMGTILRTRRVREVGPLKWQIAVDARVSPRNQ